MSTADFQPARLVARLQGILLPNTGRRPRPRKHLVSSHRPSGGNHERAIGRDCQHVRCPTVSFEFRFGSDPDQPRHLR